MLQENPKRDIYEGSAPGGKVGSGRYYVTYSPNSRLELLQNDVDALVASGTIVLRYKDVPGFYVLSKR